MDENTQGAFTAPPSVGNAEIAKSSGTVTRRSVTKDATNAVKTVKRNIKVVAIAKGWFDCVRVEIGTKFMVSESEFSEIWMEKI